MSALVSEAFQSVGNLTLAIAGPVLRPLLAWADRSRRSATAAAGQLSDSIAWLAQKMIWIFAILTAVCVIACAAFAFALLQYAALYWLIIPRMHIDKPVYFDFSLNSANALSHSTLAASASVTTAPPPDASPSKVTAPATSLSAAVASVSLVGPQWSATAATVDAYPSPAASLLVSLQAYRIDLVLSVPDSPDNARLGMVQVGAQLLAANDEPLATSSRPLTMRYENALIRLLRRTLLWAPALLGWWTEEQHLSLVLFEDFVEHSQHRATAVRVTLSHAVRVYEARLHFHAQLSGVRYLLYHWFLSSMLFFVGASVFWQLVSVAAAAYALRDSFGLDHGADDLAAADEFRGAQELFGARAALPFSQVQPRQHQQQRQNLAMNPFVGGQPLVPAQAQAPAPSRSQQLALATPPRGSAGNESVGARGVDLTVAAVAAAAAVPSVLESATVGAAAAIISGTSPSVSLAAISPLPSSSARSVAGDDTAASFAMPASATLPGLASSAAALPIPSNARLSLSEISVSESDDSQAGSNSDKDSDLDSYSHSDDDANVDEDGMIGAPTGRVRGSKRASVVEAARARTMPAAGSVSVSEDSDSQLRQRSRSSQ